MSTDSNTSGISISINISAEAVHAWADVKKAQAAADSTTALAEKETTLRMTLLEAERAARDAADREGREREERAAFRMAEMHAEERAQARERAEREEKARSRSELAAFLVEERREHQDMTLRVVTGAVQIMTAYLKSKLENPEPPPGPTVTPDISGFGPGAGADAPSDTEEPEGEAAEDAPEDEDEDGDGDENDDAPGEGAVKD